MLLDEMNREFADVVYPGDEALADSYPNEWESRPLGNLKGKDWRYVEAGDFECQGDHIEGIQALGLKGFIYFLPGLIRICLTNDADYRYTIVWGLLTRFTIPDYLSEGAEEMRKIITALSSSQRSFMIRFFSAMREADSTICPVVVDSAILNLKAGDITPYKREDVEKWVSRTA